jgi:ferredoxin-thioredoxin reductase catalytic subunit
MKGLFESYAKNKGWSLSENADKIIDGIIAKNGCCPCRLDNVRCLSCDVEKDIEKKGRCHCNLFVKS